MLQYSTGQGQLLIDLHTTSRPQLPPCCGKGLCHLTISLLSNLISATISLIFLKTGCFPLQTKSLTTSLVSSIILQANQFKRLARCVLRFFFFIPKLKFHHDSRFFHQEIKNQPEICQSNQDKFWIFYISFKNFEMFTILIRNG